VTVSLKPGARYASTVCSTEVVVVKGTGDTELCCGGAPMVPIDDGHGDGGAGPQEPFAEGTVVGKRYTDDEEAIELLCTKAGGGSLSLGDAALFVKGAKPLPSSD
jgi:hypothetical protein